MSAKPPCRQFNSPAGCRKGSTCPSPHVKTGGSTEKPASNTPDRRKAALRPGLPRGACREFWTSASCTRGFGCRYQHLPGPGTSARGNVASTDAFIEPRVGIGLVDPGASKTPGEVHATLNIFISQSFGGFRSLSQIYLFLQCLSSPRSTNPTWKPADAQNLLEALVNPPTGLRRLAECIKRPLESDTTVGWSFTRGTLPVIEYLSSEWVIKSTMSNNVNALYGVLHDNFGALQMTIEAHVPRMVEEGAFCDTETEEPISGLRIFTAMTAMLSEYMRRYKSALHTNFSIQGLVEQLGKWFCEWENALESAASFDDPCQKLAPSMRRFKLRELQNKIELLLAMLNQTRILVTRQPAVQLGVPRTVEAFRLEAVLARLRREYQGPGDLREEGPRHDNDKVAIRDIRIAPTQDELLCCIAPYLPANIVGAPHQCPAESISRVLDIQFRLLREELVAPIRSAVQLVSRDLERPADKKTQLSNIIEKKGGRYHGSGEDSVIFSVFTNVAFEKFTVDKRGCSIDLTMDAPAGDSRHEEAKQRMAYWKSASKKRLKQGGVVALISKTGSSRPEAFVGVITSTADELEASAQANNERIKIRVSFFDTEITLRVARQLHGRYTPHEDKVYFLIESSILYEAIRPFLLALQDQPEEIPFADYIRHRIDPDYLSNHPAVPPQYAQRPGFSLELRSLLQKNSGIGSLRLDANDPHSINHTRQELKRSSQLDGSQADALVDALTREISLIQGPPGTGKSYTGIEIIKALVQNKATPIILMAFTNHALDHMLQSVLEKVTKSIVRTGSRSANKVISEFSLDKVARESTEQKSTINSKFKAMKNAEREMEQLMNDMAEERVPPEDMSDIVMMDCPEHYRNIFAPPRWVSALYTQRTVLEVGWELLSGHRELVDSQLEFWHNALDIKWLTPPEVKVPDMSLGTGNRYEIDTPKETIPKHLTSRLDFLLQYGQSGIPHISETTRSLDALRKDDRVWLMSAPERKMLYRYWKTMALERMGDNRLEKFMRVHDHHEEARREYQDIQDQVQVNILKNTSVIGCTTTGAAKLVSLFKSIEPRVMIVEEAGQVLEAHILAALVPSIAQLIMIGDPLQLRPNLNNYKLSVDNPQTGEVYKFDRSLMERLSKSGLHMSRLDVQRRMRPEISSLIRNTLYDGLVDKQNVEEYPNVLGMNRNVYFLSHCYQECGGGEDSVSKHNEYEVEMIYGLVKHILRQGRYGNSPDSIVILSAYLGQIPKIHDKLKGEMTTVIDDRDVAQLAEQGVELDVAEVKEVELSKRVRVRTLDNFQGEEGDIIILSLVRNAGTRFVKGDTDLKYDKTIRASVGFLRSINRTNVALSRAKHGMYILGNAPELAAASQMWETVLRELNSKSLIGPGFPITCSHHPNYVQYIDDPGAFDVFAPNGGCTDRCMSKLACGHTCPSKCHPGNPNHIAIKCPARCSRLCPNGHPCLNLCHEDCEKCRLPVQNVILPCGHTLETTTCHASRHIGELKCTVLVEKKLLYCEHKALLPCSQEPATHKCRMSCAGLLNCCGKYCTSTCDRCMRETTHKGGPIGNSARFYHSSHPCQKPLHCGHRCAEICASGHKCSRKCQQRCIQLCSHHRCDRLCCEPCPPCIEPCMWQCPHRRCGLKCSAPCSRLPCDEPCRNTLACGHSCPSICGEPCDAQVCRMCAPETQLNGSSGRHMGLASRELRLGDNLDERTITLSCRHIFTVETLDKVTELSKFYTRDSNLKWAASIWPDFTGKIRPRLVCPTCHGPISSPRYGRIIKQADLNILEYNIASVMSSELYAAQKAFQDGRRGIEARLVSGINSTKATVLAHAALPNDKQREDANRKQATLMGQNADGPTPAKLLSKYLSKVHFVPSNQQVAWSDAVAPVLDAYTQVTRIFDKRSSYHIAYEVSLPAVDRNEPEKSDSLLSALPTNPHHLPMQLAQIRLEDAPSPRTNKRFLIEAFWVVIEIHLFLARLAQRCSELLSARQNDAILWRKFAYFLLEQAKDNSKKALDMAQDSESHRKAVLCNLLLLRAEIGLARYRFKEKISTQQMTVARKAELESRHAQYQEIFDKRIRHVKRDYDKIFDATNDYNTAAWLQANFTRDADALLRSWGEVKQSIRYGVWYGTTHEEHLNMVRLFDFSHVGEFYRCPKGHPYVHAEREGFAREHRCPECYERIGGSTNKHNLIKAPGLKPIAPTRVEAVSMPEVSRTVSMVMVDRRENPAGSLPATVAASKPQSHESRCIIA